VLKVINSISSLLIGESSKKRQIGIGLAIVLSLLYVFNLITLEIYEALMPFVLLWTGAAFSARLSKLSKAIKNAKVRKT